jgi:geranylgeranyl transferase type-2 subunit alpha
MHGRRRDEYKALQRDAAVTASLSSKAEKWNALSHEIAMRRQSSGDPITSLTLTEKMLIVNPDPMYLWNYRREMLVMKSNDSSTALESLETELRVTQAALESNPKAYGAWFHRKWALLYYLKSLQDGSSVVTNELDLTALFLQRDERNFHCWNYRRFVVSCRLGTADGQDDGEWWNSPQVGGPTGYESHLSEDKKKAVLQTEWDFTTTKIQDNFSNFSAFHYRSKLLPWRIETCDRDSDLIRSEWELVDNAIFTEPDDQTAWWYAQFLLDFVKTKEEDWYKTLLQEQIQQVRELAEEMPKSKWVCLGLYMLLEATGDASELCNLLTRLKELDPDRRARYEFLMQQHQESS